MDRLREGAAALPLLSLLGSRQRDDLLLSLVSRAMALSRCLSSPPESLPTLLASLPRTWITAIGSSTEPAASSYPSSSQTSIDIADVIDTAEASKPLETD